MIIRGPSQDPGQGGLAYGLDASERAFSVSEVENLAMGGQMCGLRGCQAGRGSDDISSHNNDKGRAHVCDGREGRGDEACH